MAEEAVKDDAKKEAKASGGGGNKLVSLIVVALVAGLAAGGGVAAVMFFGPGAHKAQAAAEGGDGHGGEAKKEEAKPVSAVIGFEPFVVNLADPAGNRYLKLTLRTVVNDAHVAEAFEKDELTKARVRDRIISVLTSKMFQDIGSSPGKETLRRELAKEINTVLPHDAVQEVLFVDFAVQ